MERAGPLLLQLGQNISILLAAVVFYAWAVRRREGRMDLGTQILLGCAYAAVALVGMSFPFRIGDGVLLDGRVVILALSGPFGGPATLLTTGTGIFAYRTWLGGDGLAAALVNIALVAGVGLAASRWPGLPRMRHLFGAGAGVVASLTITAWFLPARIRDSAMFLEMLATVMVAVFVGVVGLGLVLRREHRARQTELALAKEGEDLRLERQNLRLALAEVRAAREAAEDASRSKSDFLASMSHELRTPLNAILGFSEIIKDNLLGPGAAETYRDYARDVHSAGRHLLALVDDVLDFARMERRGVELAETEFDLKGCVLEAIGIARGEAAGYGVRIEFEDELGPASLYADRRAIKRMLLNLLSNAAKFSPEGGRILVRLAFEGGDLALSVQDDGPGIPEADLTRVLLPFERAVSQADPRPGTGLGLPMVKMLVEAHEGMLRLASEPGRGVTATLHLPAERVRVEAEPARAGAA